jgi:hypothetical protein
MSVFGVLIVDFLFNPLFFCVSEWTAFRHASVFPPVPHPLVHEKLSIKSTESIALTCIPSIDVLIQVFSIPRLLCSFGYFHL